MLIKRAFLFDSLIKDFDIYKGIAEKYIDYDDQLNIFSQIREEAVDAELGKNIALYKKLIDNILLTNISKSTKEKIELIEKYYIRDFYETPVFYGFHLINFYSKNFIKNSVQFVNKDQYLKNIEKFGTVVLNPLHNDLYQMLANYVSLISKDTIYSIYGLESPLKKIEEINKKYTPTVTNIEYNYIGDSYGLPFPLILRKALKDVELKKIVAIPPEISMGLGPQQTVNLLGRKVSMPLGSSWISTKTQIPIIIVHTEMTRQYKIKITFEDPILPYKENSKINIIRQSKQVFKKIDEIIQNTPYSWCGYDNFDKMIAKKNK